MGAVGSASPDVDLLLTDSKDNSKVYIDDDGIIHDASLNQTNIGGNNNKVSDMDSCDGCTGLMTVVLSVAAHT